ncbi:hypothetical protein J2Y45_004011 [Dyadobacter sp. BE34]|uniref:Secretion system C-terminal sorting domain-containing protein n=1 Tax=Dyadobacter fermentans TaxID=94254 RepID=A0ABU1R075_9BACT|nr:MULTISPECIES: T9SS type A sorting domain-containing protein [Dyadobacter]MDR6806819.1 hypothetical protein [Dyadobacter fermentans]MDR7044561.1 hypothetical protein [Dyadobacter sp. BE242]MDR7198871.1 hypothetical protein [Dyadobacter sp. BE34]MDR7216833.1 hypothetical protein [Dyadobacter sp. BE31]MDR7263641.1 hypothetical protein [Dyadobacter sp. BE32]
MKHILRGLLFLVHLSLRANAQTPSVTAGNPELACLGKAQRIPVTIAGSFNTDNQFSVQVRENDKPTVLATLPAVLKGENIEVVYHDSTLSAFPMLQFRIISSSPKTESSWSYFRVHSKGTVQLASAISDTVNLGEELVLKFTAFSSTEVDVTLNDGTQLELTPYSQPNFTAYHTIGAHTTEPFSIRTATNVCGAMRTSGVVKPVANATSVRTLAADAFDVCENSQVRIAFNTMGAPLKPGNKYRVRFRSSDASPFVTVKTMEAPAELKDGWVVTRVPDGLNLTAKTNFKVIIIADEHGIVGSPGDFILTVHPKPQVSFFTPDTRIELGSETRVGVVFKGVPPFSAQLGDGTAITASYSGEVYVDKSPDKTTTYSIPSMSSGCGVTNLPAPARMTVTVGQGIALVPSANPQILCAGTRVRVRIRSNGNFSAATSYTVNAVYGPSKSYSFPATRDGDYLEFLIPELPAGTPPEQLYDGLNNMYISTQNPALKSSPSYIYLIQSKPQIVSGTSDYTFGEPGLITLNYKLYGKWPFTIEDEAGNRTVVKNDWWAPEVYLDKTKDFKIRSISNACFKTENIPATRLTLTSSAAPDLYLERIPARVCANDSLEVKILAPGKFGADNEFQIQVYADCCNFTTLKTVKAGGTYKVRIPASQNGYTYLAGIKVVSKNPFLTTETYQFGVDTPLTDFVVNPAGTSEQPAMLPNNGEWSVNFTAKGGGASSAVYSDGTTEHTLAFGEPYQAIIPITATPGVTTVYTLKSMGNSCGVQPANLSTYIKVLPYEIKVAGFDFTANRFCAGNQIRVPFGFAHGSPGNGVTFSMELSRADEVTYRVIASGEHSNVISGVLPANLAEGNYKIRIVSSDGVISNTADFLVGVLPGATISSDLPQPITIPGSGYVELDVRFTGTYPWTAVYEDNTSQTATHNIRRRIYPNQGGTFELKTVYNQCGYGAVSGSVVVKVPPRLTASADNYAACNGKTFTVNYELSGDVEAGDGYIAFEVIDPQTSRIIPLDSTKVKKGSIDLKIPSNLTGDLYQLKCTFKKGGLSTDFFIYITRPVQVTISGNTVINNGGQTALILRTDNTVPDRIFYELSDGTKGSFLGGSEHYLTVNPDKTTTYTLRSVSNSCGAGTTVGSATVEVNPPAARTVSVTSYGSASMGMCVGDSMLAYYTQTGTFTAGNIMTVQLSDTTGKNFRAIPTAGKSSPLRALLPADLSPGKRYRLRVAASDAGTAAGAYPTPLTTGEKATARFAADFVPYKEGSDPVAVVLLSGSGPWQYDLVLGSNRQTRYATAAVDSVALSQALPGQVYTLRNVFGQCGTGTVGTPSNVTVTLVTAEPRPVGSQVIVAPNPARDYLQITFETALPRSITLFDSRGTGIREKQARGRQESLDIRSLATGVYLLQIKENGRKQVFRVVKY